MLWVQRLRLFFELRHPGRSDPESLDCVAPTLKFVQPSSRRRSRKTVHICVRCRTSVSHLGGGFLPRTRDQQSLRQPSNRIRAGIFSRRVARRPYSLVGKSIPKTNNGGAWMLRKCFSRAAR